ncbi:hypothetical protein MPSI1_000641 [Malassezia psittaci]|uniref:Uncharacterized protein n=1 Tax=Malassezia psittaci TaxID=1821823 RepID=A0AAF0F8G9_9BASI|nr:hypothetical protein MPSI1_000641 [Malassezia psittaci]
MTESPVPRTGSGVFLAVDLTTEVADELLEHKDVNTAIIYHPVIFSAIRSVTLAQPLQRSILRLIAAGVNIYCPHTCLDAIDGGINDWIAAGLQHDWEHESLSDDQLYKLVRQGVDAKPIEPVSSPRTPKEGVGRTFSLASEVRLSVLVERAKAHFGVDHVQFALGHGKSHDTQLKTVAVCAGSGGSVLCKAPEVDVWVTGELSHHEILATIARGTSVIVANHTNTERRFFRSLFAPLLQEQLPGITVYVSDKDRDPLQFA